MSDNNTENKNWAVNTAELPLLVRDEYGKLLKPLIPNWTNLANRLVSDREIYTNGLQKRIETRGALDVEVQEAEVVKKVLEKAGEVVYKSKSGTPLSDEDLKNMATYLDWSYQEQVGIPASVSNQEEATKHGKGALDTWALFTSIKNKLTR